LPQQAQGENMDIQLIVNEKPVNAHIALPASGKGPGVLLLHAWWGFKPFFKNFCAQLAGQGYVVLAPDMNNGVIAKTVDEAKALMETRDFDFVGEIVMAAKDFLLAYPACSSKKIGVIGFSMGAAYSMMVAAQTPEQVAATVLFYGGPGVDIGEMQSKILGHFSDVDEWEAIDDVLALEKDMRAAGMDVNFHIYPGKAHWFMEDDRPEYDPEAAGLAWERTLKFLKENL
jgi:carboxymethylenebutenolidase